MNKNPESEYFSHEGDSGDRDYSAIVVDDLRRSLQSLMKPAFTMPMETTLANAINQMQTKRIGCILITKDQRLVGIFTERDVLNKLFGSKIDLDTTPISAVMTSIPHALWEDDTIAYALNFMDLGGYRHIPIVNRLFEPIGMVSIKDIITYLVQHFADEVLNLPPHPLLREEGTDVPFTPPDSEE